MEVTCQFPAFLSSIISRLAIQDNWRFPSRATGWIPTALQHVRPCKPNVNSRWIPSLLLCSLIVILIILRWTHQMEKVPFSRMFSTPDIWQFFEFSKATDIVIGNSTKTSRTIFFSISTPNTHQQFQRWNTKRAVVPEVTIEPKTFTNGNSFNSGLMIRGV